jgi:hypothetical protein
MEWRLSRKRYLERRRSQCFLFQVTRRSCCVQKASIPRGGPSCENRFFPIGSAKKSKRNCTHDSLPAKERSSRANSPATPCVVLSTSQETMREKD